MATAKAISDMARARRMQVLHMRDSGMTFREVAQDMGISPSRAQQLYRHAERECTPGHRRPSAATLSFQEMHELMPLLPWLVAVAEG